MTLTNQEKKAPGTSVGRRIHVIGNSCAGKSTLGQRLARALDVPFVELDALNWQPGWVGLNATDPDELADPGWSHIRFIRLTSVSEVETFASAMENSG